MFGLSGSVWVLLAVMFAMGITALVIMIVASRHEAPSRVPFTEAPTERMPETPGWYIDRATRKPRWWDGKNWHD